MSSLWLRETHFTAFCKLNKVFFAELLTVGSPSFEAGLKGAVCVVVQIGTVDCAEGLGAALRPIRLLVIK